MECELFTLSDYAENYNGKLTIVGTFDSIGATTLPHVHPNLAISLKMRFSEKEFGNHPVQIRLIDTSGKEYTKINGQLTVARPNPGMTYSSANLVMRFNNLTFPDIGRYTFELDVDGNWQAAAPIHVLKRLVSQSN